MTFRTMTKQARETVEAFPSYAINRNQMDVLVKEVTVALAAAFWAGTVAGIITGIIVGILVTGILWILVTGILWMVI